MRVATDQIILRGAAISGCAVPQTEFFADIIAKELSAFILEYGYNGMTLEEAVVAMRMNAKVALRLPSGIDIEPIQFFGNTLNVEYMSKIFANYAVLRNYLDRKLQNFLDGHQ